MNVVSHCQAKYTFSENDMIGYCVYFANMTLDQNWYKPKEGKWKQDQKIKTKAGTKEKENAESHKMQYQFLPQKAVRRWLHCHTLIIPQHYSSVFIENIC